MTVRLIDRLSCDGDYLILRYKSPEMAEKIRNSVPGQYLRMENNYFAVSNVSEDTFDLMTKVDSCLSNVVEPVVEMNLLGKGFSQCDTENAIILAMGTGVGLGCYLAEWRAQRGLHTHFTAFVRGKTPIDERISALGNLWNTKKNPRPITPLYTVDLQEFHPISPEIKVFSIGNLDFVNQIKHVMESDYNMNHSCVITNY